MWKFHLPTRKTKNLFASQSLKPGTVTVKVEPVKENTPDEGSRLFQPTVLTPKKI